MIWQVGPSARVIRLLGFPGHNATLDIDFPRTRSGAIDTMGAAHNLVMRPAVSISVFPSSVLSGRYAMATRKGFFGF